MFVGRCVTDVVLEVDAEAGLRPGARLTVNVVESVQRPQFKHDRDMEELTGAKMYDALSLSVSPQKKNRRVLGEKEEVVSDGNNWRPC